MRDTGGVDRQVVGGGQLGLGAFDGRTIANVEITTSGNLASAIAL
jgi:hypothetical protein